MELRIRVEMDNAAFAGRRGRAREVARICDRIAERMGDGETDGKVRDSNGNTVGEWEVVA